MAREATKVRLEEIYQRLFKQFGPQFWWPGDTPFEIIVGAILTQNTNWGNVEQAIRNLKKARVLSPSDLNTISVKKLAALIKPSGYFNVKAKRLKNFITFLFQEYDGRLNQMAKEPLPFLRGKILSVNGIGPETADSILLYAFGKQVFVIDAYTQRVLYRHYILNHKSDYHAVQNIFMEHLKKDTQMFNEYHALFVRLGKEFCRPKPRCEPCPLNSMRKRLSEIRGLQKRN